MGERKSDSKWFSHQECLEIGQELEDNDIQFATEYGINLSTVSRIRKIYANEKKLMEEQEMNVKNKKSHSFRLYSNLDKQLYDWYVKQKESEDRISWHLLCKAAHKIMNNTKERPLHLDNWLKTFLKRRNIQDIHKETNRIVDEQLLNWLLERIKSRDIISDKLLTDETNKLMNKFNKSMNRGARKTWLCRFKECHEILVKSDILQNLIQGGDETDQSDKINQLPKQRTNEEKNIEFCKQYTNLEKRLFNWLLERKESGQTISHTMLIDETLKLIIEEFDRSAEENWLWKIGKRYFLSNSYTFEMFQRQIQRINEQYVRGLSDAKKFICELNQRLEKENINKDNIYNVIKIDVIIRKFDDAILLNHAEGNEINMEKIDAKKLKTHVTAIFCTNVTGSNKLQPITVNELKEDYENQSLQEDIEMKESKGFELWYKNKFKESVEQHQLNENITGKVLLLVDNCMQHIPLEEITQDDDFEILILPVSTVSFFQPLYPKLINKINKRYSKCFKCSKCSKTFPLDKNYNINLYTNVIRKIWFRIASKKIEKLWRKFLKQAHQTQKDTPALTSAQLVNYLTKVHS